MTPAEFTVGARVRLIRDLAGNDWYDTIHAGVTGTITEGKCDVKDAVATVKFDHAIPDLDEDWDGELHVCLSDGDCVPLVTPADFEIVVGFT